MLETLIKFFVVFFVVVEPISLVPFFAGLTQGASDQYKKRMAGKAAAIALALIDRRLRGTRRPDFAAPGA